MAGAGLGLRPRKLKTRRFTILIPMVSLWPKAITSFIR